MSVTHLRWFYAQRWWSLWAPDLIHQIGLPHTAAHTAPEGNLTHKNSHVIRKKLIWRDKWTWFPGKSKASTNMPCCLHTVSIILSWNKNPLLPQSSYMTSSWSLLVPSGFGKAANHLCRSDLSEEEKSNDLYSFKISIHPEINLKYSFIIYPLYELYWAPDHYTVMTLHLYTKTFS